MRTLAEWLLVPLLLLPLVAAGGLFVWARDAHRRDLRPFRTEGEQTARAWLTEPSGAAAEMPFDARLRDVVDRAYGAGGIMVHLPARDAGLVLDEPVLGREAWTFADRFPDGLAPDALADPGVRLQIESGRAPVEIGGRSAEAAAFAALLDAPTLVALRRAALPSATKRFLVFRWLDQDPANEEARGAARLLEIVRRLERALDALPAPLGPGAWIHKDLRLLVAPGPSGRVAVFAEDARTSPAPDPLQLASDGAEGDAARLVWAFPDWTLPKEDVLWRGRLDQPFAGAFAFQSKHGPHWWQAPRVTRYAGPVLALLLASLLLPLALFVTVRRRRRLDEARVRFLNELAHDLRTPLTSLRLHADLLQSGKAKPEKRDGYAARIATESARLSSLLGNLLDLSRLESGRRAYEIATVGIAGVADGARQELRAVFPSRKDDVLLQGDPDVAAAADRSALSRALLNLLENAAKFTTPGTPIRVRWTKEGDTVAIVVEDDGPGIAPEERGRIFDRYRRGRAAQQDGIPGTGLGLALVKELVEGMGGTVSLMPKVGAAFEIRLGVGDA